MTTISVASFNMRIPGIPDITVNAGSVSGLPFNSLQYIFFDDPGFVGGTVAFQVTTNKETALNGAGRFYVGSITTPRDGAPDTIGNNDGGSGAQIGAQTFISAGTLSTDLLGTGVVTNLNYAADNDLTSYADISVTGGAGNSAVVSAYNFTIPNRPWKSLTLEVRTQIVSYSQTNGFVRLRYSLDNGVNNVDIFNVSTTRALQTDSIALSTSQNNMQVQVVLQIDNNFGSVGDADVHYQEVRIVGIE